MGTGAMRPWDPPARHADRLPALVLPRTAKRARPPAPAPTRGTETACRMEPTAAQRAARDRIAPELARAGSAPPGTLTVRAYACGKSDCRCHASPLRLHGPTPNGRARSAARPSPADSPPANWPNTSPCSTTRKGAAPCSPSYREADRRTGRASSGAREHGPQLSVRWRP
jgi:hypothetical protein